MSLEMCQSPASSTSSVSNQIYLIWMKHSTKAREGVHQRCGSSASCLAYLHLPLFLRIVPRGPHLRYALAPRRVVVPPPPRPYRLAFVLFFGEHCASVTLRCLHYRDAVPVSRASPTSTCFCSTGLFSPVFTKPSAKDLRCTFCLHSLNVNIGAL